MSLDYLNAFVEVPEEGMQPLLDRFQDDDEDTPDDTCEVPRKVTGRKHSPRVTIPGKGSQIYKATLVSLLNQDLTLSHDRYETLTTLGSQQRH